MEFIYILPEGPWEALALQEVLGGNEAEIQHYTQQQAVLEDAFSDVHGPRTGEKGLTSPLKQRPLKILKISRIFLHLQKLVPFLHLHQQVTKNGKTGIRCMNFPT